jgi:hypothetical protein
MLPSISLFVSVSLSVVITEAFSSSATFATSISFFDPPDPEQAVMTSALNTMHAASTILFPIFLIVSSPYYIVPLLVLQKIRANHSKPPLKNQCSWLPFIADLPG